MGNILAPSEPYAKFSIHALELNGSNCSKSYQLQHDAQRNFSSDAPEFGGRVQVRSWRQKLNSLPIDIVVRLKSHRHIKQTLISFS
jgi:hypothetical protein